MYMTTTDEKREAARTVLEEKRLHAEIERALKREAARKVLEAKRNDSKTSLAEKRAAAEPCGHMDEFERIVAELEAQHAAVLDMMVLDGTVCVFAQKRVI
jgi:hypothetical protein